MKSPLRKRIPRELKGEIGKYLVVFILMVATIGMVSGFLVADGSMIQAYDEGFEKYNIEDGNFRTGERLYRGQREAILFQMEAQCAFSRIVQRWIKYA